MNARSIGPEGRALMRLILLQGNNAPVADVPDRPLLRRLQAEGHIYRHGPGRALLALTAKGQNLMTSMMRCE